MLKLSFKQTKAEFMVRIASTLIFNQLVKANTKTVSIREITEGVQYGYTEKSSSDSDLGPKYVRITDLKDGRVNWETVPYCKCDDPEQYLLKQNDLIFARTGATTGKTHLFRETPPYAVFASYLIRVRPTKKINPEYLYFFFQSDLYWSQVSTHKEGSAQPNVNGQKLSNIELPIADEETQKAICRFLTVVRARQDGFSQELPELPFPLDEQRHIIERVEVLAAHITNAQSLREEADREIEILQDAILMRVFQNLEKQFSPVYIGESNLSYNNHTRNPQKDNPDKEFLYVDIAAVENGTGKITSPQKIMGNNAPSRARRVIKENDILLSTVRPNLKAFAIVPPELDNQICSTGFAVFSNKPEILPIFLLYQFLSPYFVNQAIETVTGGHYPALNDKAINSLQVILPPLDEQRRIVAYLDSVQARLASLRELQSATGEELDALLPSMLDRAFKGEL